MLNEQDWSGKNTADIFEILKTGEKGLEAKETADRLREYGANKLPEQKADGYFRIFLRQFQSPLIYILLAAGAAVFAIGEMADGLIILAVLVFNAAIGTIQEGRAQNTLSALKKFVETKATVLRGGEEMIISDAEVVPGDIILLNEGEKVPADARIIVSSGLQADESAMTGESNPAHKTDEIASSADLSSDSSKNMVFKGTNIVLGSGKAVVFATGANTKIGKIAVKIADVDADIPLKTNLRDLSKMIIYAVSFINIVIMIVGAAAEKPIKEIMATVVSLSVSMIPEGLPIVVTLILAAGVWRMSKRNALVKKLQAVEALGQARVIAVDKTGTLTKNELVVQKVYAAGNLFDVAGVGYEPKGGIFFKEKEIDASSHREIIVAARIAAYCAGARVMFSKAASQWQIAGDPTEGAMLVFSQKAGFDKTEAENEYPIISQNHFDYKLKYRGVIFGGGKERILAVSGAPETIIGLCSKIMDAGGETRPLSKKGKKRLEDIFFEMSLQGFRVIGLARKFSASKNFDAKKVKNLEFIGLLGMKDSLRPEAVQAVKKTELAGMRVVMITGDHSITAQTAAKEAGIYKEGDLVLSGTDIDALSDEELAEKIARVSVFARVDPDHKLRIIMAFRARREIVAMTGDGVNDAPSLAAADLGVAMGVIGTEVAKEASDIVLLDDNFASIVSAIEEGRSIYKTIKKVVLYLFSTSLGEALTIIGALLMGFPLPILPGQIIWLNFVTDGFLDVSLAMEPKEKGLLKSNFQRPKKYFIDKPMAWRMLFMALVMATGSLFLFSQYFESDQAKAWTVSLVVLAAFQWFNAWNCRSENKSIFRLNPFSNKMLAGATVIVIGLQVFAVYNPFMQKILHTVPLDLIDWVKIIAVALLIVLAEELRKLWARKNKK
ncbi:MAG: HAD-IC family P-type ATPase [Candidatus Paceibacterota bacterium]|jgi:Ca2+-transporting ATPase